jgi:hypothetical protein
MNGSGPPVFSRQSNLQRQKSLKAQSSIAGRVYDRDVAEPILNGPRVNAIVRQLARGRVRP